MGNHHPEYFHTIYPRTLSTSTNPYKHGPGSLPCLSQPSPASTSITNTIKTIENYNTINSKQYNPYSSTLSQLKQKPVPIHYLASTTPISTNQSTPINIK